MDVSDTQTSSNCSEEITTKVARVRHDGIGWSPDNSAKSVKKIALERDVAIAVSMVKVFPRLMTSAMIPPKAVGGHGLFGTPRANSNPWVD